MVLWGLGRHLGKAVSQKRGLTPKQLMSMYAKLDFHDINVITMWTAIIFSFRTLLRKSNVAQTTLKDTGMVVLRSDIEFTVDGLIINVRKTKTLQRKEYVLKIPVRFISNKSLCAASMVGSHLYRTGFTREGPLFLVHKQGQWRPLLYADLLRFIKECVKLIGLPPEDVGLHSLRRSGAAWMI